MKQKVINICTVRDWILRKIAMMIRSKHATIHNVILGQPYCAYADTTNLYVDVFNTYTQKYKSKAPQVTHVGFMTHNIYMKDDFWSKLDEARDWKSLDGIIVMGERYKKIILDHGYKGEILVAIPGNFARRFHISPIKVTIAQRGSINDDTNTISHYGQDFLIELINEYPHTMLHVEFMIIGDGWDQAMAVMKENGVKFENWKDSDMNTIYPKSYQDCYDWCDYLFVPILETAGPMCLPEALACGKPSICGDVGWANHEFGIEHLFKPGDVQQCGTIFKKLVKERETRRNQIEGCDGDQYNWQKFATNVVDFIASVDEKVQGENNE